MKMEGGSGSRCMRSQMGPEWSVKELLILVNEIAAVEADCLKALSTYQKWKIISENCTALDVPRTSNQCRRKWDSLLAHYTKSRKNENLASDFDVELVKAIDGVVRARENQSDTEPDSDPEAKSDLCEVIAQLDSVGKLQPRIQQGPRGKEGVLCQQKVVQKKSPQKKSLGKSAWKKNIAKPMLKSGLGKARRTESLRKALWNRKTQAA